MKNYLYNLTFIIISFMFVSCGNEPKPHDGELFGRKNLDKTQEYHFQMDPMSMATLHSDTVIAYILNLDTEYHDDDAIVLYDTIPELLLPGSDTCTCTFKYNIIKTNKEDGNQMVVWPPITETINEYGIRWAYSYIAGRNVVPWWISCDGGFNRNFKKKYAW
jgi:hypothetical protein